MHNGCTGGAAIFTASSYFGGIGPSVEISWWWSSQNAAVCGSRKASTEFGKKVPLCWSKNSDVGVSQKLSIAHGATIWFGTAEKLKLSFIIFFLHRNWKGIFSGPEMWGESEMEISGLLEFQKLIDFAILAW